MFTFFIKFTDEVVIIKVCIFETIQLGFAICLQIFKFLFQHCVNPCRSIFKVTVTWNGILWLLVFKVWRYAQRSNILKPELSSTLCIYALKVINNMNYYLIYIIISHKLVLCADHIIINQLIIWNNNNNNDNDNDDDDAISLELALCSLWSTFRWSFPLLQSFEMGFQHGSRNRQHQG